MQLGELAPHRKYVANCAKFSTGADVFHMLTDWGLQQEHTLCDVGCGSLRVGRFLIMYLERGCYWGIEPNQEILKAGIEYEVSEELCNLKEIILYNVDDYGAGITTMKFDWVLIAGVLVHKAHWEIDRALVAASAMLKPGGSLVVDYYPGDPHWVWVTNPTYPAIACHERECLLQNTDLEWAGDERELGGSRFIRLVKV